MGTFNRLFVNFGNLAYVPEMAIWTHCVTASGDRMTVLGTVIVYLHPTGADTRQVYGIVTHDLRERRDTPLILRHEGLGAVVPGFPQGTTYEKQNKESNQP